MKKIIFLILITIGISNAYWMDFNSKVSSEWEWGFCYKFFVENNSNIDHNNWKLNFDLKDTTMTSTWNWKFNCNNWKCEVVWVTWNNNIKVNQKFEIWFCASWNSFPENIIFKTDNINKSNINIGNKNENKDSKIKDTKIEDAKNEDKDNINKDTKNENFIKSNDLIIAPYVDATLYPILQLYDIYKKTWHKDFTLAFLVSNNWKCEASWGWYYNLEKWPSSWTNWEQYFLYDDIEYIKNKWWEFILSFWGAYGKPLFVSCNSKDLKEQYENIINKLWIYRLDFDIEWVWITKTDEIDKLVKVLKYLKIKYPQLTISFTLPVMQYWLTADWVNVLKILNKNNFEDIIINIMTMNYGYWDISDMWDNAIEAAINLNRQMKEEFWVNKNYFNQIWITPMIWLNDIITEKFTLEDAEQLSNFAIKNNLAVLSYWSLNRDNACSNSDVKLKCSSQNIQSKSYEFLKAFKWNSNQLEITNKKEEVKEKEKTKKEDIKEKYETEKIDYHDNIDDIIIAITEKKEDKNDDMWKNKIEDLSFKIKVKHSFSNNESIFERFFNIKKQIIIKNTEFHTEEYYDILKSFIEYSELLFTDKEKQNFSNIKNYINELKSIINFMKNIK